MLETRRKVTDSTKQIFGFFFSVVIIVALIGSCVNNSELNTMNTTIAMITAGLEECPKDGYNSSTIWVKNCKEYTNSRSSK